MEIGAGSVTALIGGTKDRAAADRWLAGVAAPWQRRALVREQKENAVGRIGTRRARNEAIGAWRLALIRGGRQKQRARMIAARRISKWMVFSRSSGDAICGGWEASICIQCHRSAYRDYYSLDKLPR